MTIAEWLKEVSDEFADNMIPSARLDAEIILAHTINRPRTWLHAHGDEQLDPRRRDIADARAELRLERVPVAYIIGHKHFYNRQFNVSPDVLIPRPESEQLIELLKEHAPDTSRTLVDVGTGSGCLGITAKLESPRLDVTLTDTSENALKMAQKNAELNDADVRTLKSNLLDAYPLRADILIANLPYVDISWSEQSPELTNEPALALYAEDNGLALIKELLQTAGQHLSHGALVLLEADPRQHEAIKSYAEMHGFRLITVQDYALAFNYLG